MHHKVQPALEHYLGIPGSFITLFILIVGLALFFYIIYKRYLLLKSANPDPRFDSLWRRFYDLIIYGIFQKRQPRYLWIGILHIMIFWGFVVLILRSIALYGLGLKAEFILPFMGGSPGEFYHLFKDILEIIVLFACIAAILRRAISRPARYEFKHGKAHKFHAYLVLGLISFLMVTDIAMDGSGTLLGEKSDYWLPAANSVSYLFNGLGPDTLKTIYLWNYWLHILTLMVFLNYLPLGKHFHIITGIFNVFLSKLKKGSIKPPRWGVENIEELDSLGVDKVEDFTWKHILDFYTCTECGRCTDNCPANIVGRPLSPMEVTLKIRDYAYESNPIFNLKGKADSPDQNLHLIGNVITPDEIWSCTTCGACEEECPVFIEYIDKMVEMRRHLVLMESRFPPEIEKIFRNMEVYDDPWGMGRALRTDWAGDLKIKTITEDSDIDLLYWVGCAGAFDDRCKEVAASLVRVLQESGVTFGILGKEERCCGDFARRTGNEYLFQVLVRKNIEILKKCKVKKILTSCPHCYNTFKNEYPQFGGEFEVIHHSEYIAELIKEGNLKLSKELDKTISYHDPCYLGRHNGLYEAPREILKLITGIKTIELERSRDRSFCCGAGGGRYWMEEYGKRINETRIDEVIEVKPDIITTACPYCLIMLEEGIKAKEEVSGELKALDIIEIVEGTI